MNKSQSEKKVYAFQTVFRVDVNDVKPFQNPTEIDGWLRMGLLPPPREFCRHILSCRELKAESFKRCLHSVLRGVSL